GGSAPHFVHRRPVLDWHHDLDVARAPAFDALGQAIAITLGDPGCPVQGVTFQGNCSIAGAFCGRPDWPDGWRGACYHADDGVGWIRRFDFDPQDRLLGVQLFAQPVGKVMWICEQPDDGSLWYIDYGITGTAAIHRISYFGAN